MKKLIIAWATAGAMVLLSGCSTTSGTNSSANPGMTNGPQSGVAFPENSGNNFHPSAAPNLPTSPANEYVPPPAGPATPNGY